MKHSHRHPHPQDEGPHPEPVCFEFNHPTARAVSVAGSFNGWRADAKPLHPLGEGRWVKETVLLPGTYEYCLVVDGVWMPDPRAQDSVPNPFGGRNSVLHVTRLVPPTGPGVVPETCSSKSVR